MNQNAAISTSMSRDEFYFIAKQLEKYHEVFYRFWELGNPIWSNRISTAAVSFDKSGKVLQFMINPEYWQSCSLEKKLFTICHECLHVILNHGVRSRGIPVSCHTQANIATDIVVNHILTENMGFNRNDIEGWEDFCWIDTVFNDNNKVERNRSFEYYYGILSQTKSNNKQLVDSHEFFDGKDLSEVVKNISDQMSPHGANSLRDIINKHYSESPENDQKNSKNYDFDYSGLSRGTVACGVWKFVNPEIITPKKKWETVIKNWQRKNLREIYRDEQQWVRLNRRFVSIAKDSNMFLPTDEEVEYFEKNRIEVMFFMDASGSCENMSNRFFSAALSLNRKFFDVRLFSFDTQVYELNQKDRKMAGYGGTSFDCIEAFIQKEISTKNIDYPKAVFVLTDGYGNDVKPQYPQNWYWFLTSNYTYFIPKDSNFYMLSDFI